MVKFHRGMPKLKSAWLIVFMAYGAEPSNMACIRPWHISKIREEQPTREVPGHMRLPHCMSCKPWHQFGILHNSPCCIQLSKGHPCSGSPVGSSRPGR